MTLEDNDEVHRRYSKKGKKKKEKKTIIRWKALKYTNVFTLNNSQTVNINKDFDNFERSIVSLHRVIRQNSSFIMTRKYIILTLFQLFHKTEHEVGRLLSDLMHRIVSTIQDTRIVNETSKLSSPDLFTIENYGKGQWGSIPFRVDNKINERM